MLKRSKASPLQIAYKSIRLREQPVAHSESIGRDFGLSPVTSRILAARGFQPSDELRAFLEPSLREGLPHPSALKSLKEACAVIREATADGGTVAIACDFDVDGLSGGSLLYSFLRACQIRARVFVPDRFQEGYGLNERIIREAKTNGHAVLVTIDYGTTNSKELLLARELGLKTVVVDHHHVHENPPADVFINPHQDGCGFAGKTLCAAGLAWYLTLGLRKELPQAAGVDPKEFLDLACLGTICDMVPLHGANRVIAKRGLELLERSKRPGLIALKNVIGAQKKLSCSHISFGIGPRLNAAGRLVSGELVVELLTTEDSKAAEKIAKKLDKLNRERQTIEEDVKESAIKKLEDRGELSSGIVVWDETFHTGVIGIVAQRLVERFHRPAAVIGFDNGMFKGSVRGISGFSVVEALSAVSEYLEKFGGHEGAGGFSLRPENLEAFAAAFDQVAAARLDALDIEPYVTADTTVDLPELVPAIVRELKRFEPHGIGNPAPVIVLEDLEVLEVKILKDAHLKVTFSDGRKSLVGMMWRVTDHPALAVGNRVRIAGKPDLNTFRGFAEMQLVVQAAELAA